jgi:putative ABC transport system permease protein
MVILLKKALRSIWRHKKTYISCVVLICLGIMLFTLYGIAGATLTVSKDKYYSEYRMADAFASVRSIPISDVEAALKIEGISDVQGRIVYDAQINNPDSDIISKLRLISINPSDANPLNRLAYSTGEFYDSNQIMVTEGFLKAYSLEIGDSVHVVIEGKDVTLPICAIAQSPDYVYIVDEDGGLLPDEYSFSVAYIQESELAGLTGARGIYNDVSFKLAPGYDFDAVKTDLEDFLEPYGQISLVSQNDQFSNSMLKGEIDSINAMATSIPLVFVAISAVVLYLMLKRIIQQDRTQIGTLKAFGYTDFQILGHYTMYGAITGCLGGILGCIFGFLASSPMVVMYNDFFKMPELYRTGSGIYIIIGMAISIAVGALGALMGAWRIVQLNPADSMRPPAPPMQKHKADTWFSRHLNSRCNMAIRSITRNKVRSGFLIAGLMFSFSILTFMGSYSSMIDDMMFAQYTKIQRFDGKIIFKQPVAFNEGMESIYATGSVILAEELLEIPTTFTNKHLSETAIITGIDANSTLYKVYDTAIRKDLQLPPDGIILTKSLAEKLHISKGGEVYISEDISVIVRDIATQSLGTGAYADIDFLAELTHTNYATSVIFTTDNMAAIKEEIPHSSNIQSLQDQANIREKTIAFMEPYTILGYIFLLLGIVVAFAIVYNTSSITLMERSREYSTLRVVGLEIREVAGILGIEYWALGSIGMFLGIFLSKAFKIAIAKSVDMSGFTMPTNISLESYLIGFICCITAIYLSGLAAKHAIKKMDMVEVLKERE